MIKPDTDDLLAGIRAALEADVLPELPEGGPRRQLRSALHTLARIERSWGRRSAYLLADREDIRSTLLRLPAPAGDSWEELSARLGSPEAAEVASNARLEDLLVEVDSRVRSWPAHQAERDEALDLLLDLYRRMLERQDFAWGTDRAERS